MKYLVTKADGTKATHECDDVQITNVAVKLLNGKGKAATIVAYYAASNVVSVVEVRDEQ